MLLLTVIVDVTPATMSSGFGLGQLSTLAIHVRIGSYELGVGLELRKRQVQKMVGLLSR